MYQDYIQSSKPLTITLRKKCPYSEFSGPHFAAFGLNSERYEVSFPYSVQKPENVGQNNSE